MPVEPKTTGHMYTFGCCARGADNPIHQPDAMTNSEAVDMALSALTYRRAMREADSGARRRLTIRQKRAIEWDVARLSEAMRRIRAIRDLGLAEEMEVVTVTIPSLIGKTVTLPSGRPAEVHFYQDDGKTLYTCTPEACGYTGIRYCSNCGYSAGERKDSPPAYGSQPVATEHDPRLCGECAEREYSGAPDYSRDHVT
jgi:hypothetical protein